MKRVPIRFVALSAAIISLACLYQLCGHCASGIAGKEGQGNALSIMRHSVASEEYPIYLGSQDNKETIKLYFVDEGKDVPYVDAHTAQGLLERFYHDVNGDKQYSLSVGKEGSVTTFTRENGSSMAIDSDQDKIHFDNFDAFFKPSWSNTIIDPLEHYGAIKYLQNDEEQSYSCSGPAVDLDLGKYGIDVIESDGECCMPMQTFSDIATSVTCYVNLVYNKQAVYAIEYASSQEASDLADKVYEAPTGTRSKELADFSYRELCMVLDYFYGLKEQHGIDHFDDYLTKNGFKDRLLSEDPKESTQAVYDLMDVHIGDMHSGYVAPSYLLGAEHRPDTSRTSQAMFDSIDAIGRITKARYERYPDDPPGYEEVDNTSYITFGSFKPLEEGKDYYKDSPTADTQDTVGLCLYAFSQITREGSPIKNVVLDIADNSGGDATTLSFVLSMFLGEASMCVENTLTGAYANAFFVADANLDGGFDNQKDTLRGYNLYCLTSPGSFSAANLAASVFKRSHQVTIIGQHTSGGACIVMPLSLADGTLVQISGNRSYSYMTNGAVHDVDEGVEPDIYIAKPESFSDRSALTELINHSL